MQADPAPQAQDQPLRIVPDEPADELPDNYVAWQKIGRQALYVEARTRIKTLGEVLAECAALVIIETWLAHGRNMTRASEALGISRKRVRRVLNAWREAQAQDQDR